MYPSVLGREEQHDELSTRLECPCSFADHRQVAIYHFIISQIWFLAKVVADQLDI
jgi:hypothetical protein